MGPLLSPILIGRDDVLDLAERRLLQAASGRGQFLLFAGEAGVGKSRLLSAVDLKARRAGFRTAGGFLAPQDQQVPMASLLDMARSMTRDAPWMELGRQLLVLADAAMTASGPRRRTLVLQAVDLMVGALAGPTLFAFDDLQWADNLSLEILTELARSTRERPVLLVAAYRSDELVAGALLREWRSRLLTQRIAEEARLAPLSVEQTALMTSLILATGLPAPSDVAAAVHERTDGVPLHIEELLGALPEDLRADSRAIRAADVPETLEDAILQRIHRLSPEAQDVARRAAVIGRCFVPHVLAEIVERPAEALERPLRELVDHSVLHPPGPRGLFDFRHQLLRDVLYGSLSDGERRRLHARAAEYGKELEGASEIHDSRHYELAGMAEPAFHSALQGARLAARLSSHHEAFELYRRAVANLPPDLPPRELAEILEAFSVEAAAIEEIDTCEQAALQARECWIQAGDALAAADQRVTLAGMARRQARPLGERLDLTRAALAELDALPAQGSTEAGAASPGGARAARVRSALSIELAYASIEAGDAGGAAAALNEAHECAIEAADEGLELWSASLDGVQRALTASSADGLARAGAAAESARARGFEDCGVTGYRDAAVAAASVLEYRQAAAWIDKGQRYADAIEQSHCGHVMRATAALVAWAEGRWDDSIGLAEHALADRGCRRAAGMARWPRAYAAIGRGEFETARGHLAAAELFGRTSDVASLVLPALWGLVELSSLEGDHGAAIRLSEEALVLARTARERASFAPIVVPGVRARLVAGSAAAAARWLEATDDFLGPVRWYSQPALDHAWGLLRLTEGATGVARTHLQSAMEGWAARPRTWEALWARLDLAGCLLRSGRHAQAAGLIGDVRDTAGQLRSVPLLRAAEELDRLVRRRDSRRSAWYPLTAREFDVARLIARGLTNSQIAAELSVAPRTVSAHVEHVLAKLGAQRRAEIASWATRTEPDPSRGTSARDGAAPAPGRA
ncbi:MAG TPA: LuxR C-terminal-related transcriptional regulator [Candidatus Limnocylindrales bacterium]